MCVRVFSFVPEDGASATASCSATSLKKKKKKKRRRKKPPRISPAQVALLPVSDFPCAPRHSAMEAVFHTKQQGLQCALRVAPLLLLLLLLFLNAAVSAQEKTSQCHNYAGGHVYPGEAFRVPVSDHSLHLSKAKSEFCWREPTCEALRWRQKVRACPSQVAGSCCSTSRGATGQTLGSLCTP